MLTIFKTVTSRGCVRRQEARQEGQVETGRAK